MTTEDLAALGDLIGFVSAGLLTFQAYRLVTHLRTLKQWRESQERAAGSPLATYAKDGADAFERNVTRWDAKDERLVFAGLALLIVSFVLKLAAYAIR